MRKLFYSILLLIIGSIFCSAQDIGFAQHEQSEMLINPALTGNFEEHGRAILHYRNQWKHITGTAYNTFGASIEANLIDKFGVGIQFLKDQTGIHNYSTNQLNSSFSLQTELNSMNYLGFGVQLSWTQKYIDYGDQTWNSQYDGFEINTEIPTGEVNINTIQFVDVSAGWVWKYKNPSFFNFDIGIGAYHLSRPKYTQSSLETVVPMRWTGMVNVDLLQWQNSQVTIHPSLRIENQDYQTQTTIGGYTKIKFGLNSKYTDFYKNSYFQIGGYYTVNQTLTSYLRLDYISIVSATFTYDFIVSDLATSTNMGGTEISIAYYLK
ncbi:MAG: PorP/SprF family type IX secretion system membrane protein [Bacteroidales bacterium]|jgi:type IX secretion system PorP/SprF family membrane protein|nr:PorP/SprF family type IX secretion system membrane protein [Bacteroidales bacterium]